MRARWAIAATAALPLAGAVVVMIGRVGDEARFVGWPVAAFTALAAGVSVVGVWTGMPRPVLLLAGLLPALVISYFLPVAPLPVIALFLIGIGFVAVRAGGVASGMAAATGALMVLFVVLQGPAVECGRSGVSAGSGPWWIRAADASSGSGTASADGVLRGTTQVGQRRYSYVCAGGELVDFRRAATVPPG